MEDGGVYQNALILSTKGMARSKRDVHCALKYEGCITICCKYAVNKRLLAKDIYAVEEIKEFKEVVYSQNDDDVEEDDFEELTDVEENN